MNMELTSFSASLTLATFMVASGAAHALVDLSPWKNPAGPNTGLTPDITLSTSPVQDAVPVQVNVSICNRGDESVTSGISAPIQVKLRGSQGEDLVTDSNNDTKSLATGVAIVPGSCTSVFFIWTPIITQGVTAIQATVDPAVIIADADRSNNTTTRAITFVAQPPVVPDYVCQGFYTPFDHDLSIKRKSKGTIPVKLELKDEYGVAMTDSDITAPPVINVTFNSTVYGDATTDDSALESVGSSNSGNQFTFNSAEQLWEYRLGTKQFLSPGTYQVTVASGDNTEYTINTGNQCSQSFIRQN